MSQMELDFRSDFEIKLDLITIRIWEDMAKACSLPPTRLMPNYIGWMTTAHSYKS